MHILSKPTLLVFATLISLHSLNSNLKATPPQTLVGTHCVVIPHPCCPGCLNAPIDTGEGSLFNCACKGSYLFPVPALYTSHWVGLYSQRLPTDYRSLWRFPPIKPYREAHHYRADEQQVKNGTDSKVLSTSLVVEKNRHPRNHRPIRMSRVMDQFYGP